GFATLQARSGDAALCASPRVPSDRGCRNDRAGGRPCALVEWSIPGTDRSDVCLLAAPEAILLLNSFGVVRSLSDSSRYRAPLTHCGLSCRCEAALWKRNLVRPRNNQSPQPNSY